MLKFCRHSGMFLCSTAVMPTLAGAPEAFAQKVTYEQAWAKCKADVNKNLPGESAASAARYARGGACMMQYGYRLKRSNRAELDD